MKKRYPASGLLPGAVMVGVSMLAIAVAYMITLWWVDAAQRLFWRDGGVVTAAVLAWIPAAWRLERRASFRAIKMEWLALGAVSGAGLHALVFITLLYLFNLDNIAVSSLAVFYASMLVILPAMTVAGRSIIKHFRRLGRGVSRVVVVGDGETASRLCHALQSDPGFGYRLLGIFAASPRSFNELGVYDGDYSELADFVKVHAVDEIYCTVSEEEDPGLRLAVRVAEQNLARCYFVPRLSRYAASGLEMHEIGHMVVIAPRESPLQSVVARILKRSCDIVVAGVGTVLLALLLVPVSLAIKLTSPGPVFYRQRRTGYMGGEFTCLKFRTMNCRTVDNGAVGRNDPRVTPVGRFLRHTSLDELPQVINILAGDMSVVGPRPHMISQTEEYSRLIDRYMVRHSVRPGLTGWAQVNGLRGTTDQLWKMERRVEHDVWYIEHWSLMLDLKIILRTAVNILRGDKNAF